jgi:Trk K+ transport system NAD-binding subunit
MLDGSGRRTAKAQALYLWVLLRRFRGTFLSLFLLVFGGGSLLWWFMARAGRPIPWPRALLSTYFLFFAQPIFEMPDDLAVGLLCVAIPPLGIITVAEGLVRFAYLFFARQREDKEWFAVLAQTLHDHVIICGGGRVGFRVFEQLHKLGVSMVIIEKVESSPLLAQVRDAGVPVLVADVRSPQALQMANIARARAVVCATDDDLANLNIALDAKKLRPGIRVVLRLFDDDLVHKTRDTFEVEAFSTSALAAPAFAVAALDPSIRNSFEVGGRLMVVGVLAAGAALAGRTVAELRDEQGAVTLHVARAAGGEVFDPRGAVRIEKGDRVTVQATLEAYRALRAT